MEIANFGQQVHDIKLNRTTDGPLGQEISAAAHARNAERKGIVTESEQILNGGIIDSNVDISLQDGENTLSLVYRAAVQNINESLSAAVGSSDIQVTTETSTNDSPEATASNIVSQSTGLLDSYVAQVQAADSEISEADAFTQFLSVIREGLDKGFAEARAVLSNLNVEADSYEPQIQATEELAAQKLGEFENNHVIGEQSEPNTDNAA